MAELVAGDELIKGKTYRIRLTDGSWTDGVYLYTRGGETHDTAYFTHRRNTHFMFRNVRTGREIEIKSRQRIRTID